MTDGNHPHGVNNRSRRIVLPLWLATGLLVSAIMVPSAVAIDGTLTLRVHDEATGEPTITRMRLWRAGTPEREPRLRKVVPAGMGVVVDRELELMLPEADYQFEMIRGPEYRIITGTFSLEKTSLDEHEVGLPRMVDMLENGWISGDCCVPASPYSLPMRMASEDLHVAATLGHVDARPVPGRDADELPEHPPLWIRQDLIHDDGLVVYQTESNKASTSNDSTAADLRSNGELPVQWLVRAASDEQMRVAVENPFAWQLPVWLASEQVDGFFVLGDWLRLDRSISRVRDGRPPQGPTMGGPTEVGRWAERIYWNLLEAGFRIAPLAGSGDQSGDTPVGYNRLYIAGYPDSADAVAGAISDQDQWWKGVWAGRSMATNGPLLRPRLGGQLPGHVFHARSGEALQLQPELNLAVRDPVDYLEVIHNGRVHYSARLDEFAREGGVIPKLTIKESSWVIIRVVTLHEEHFRAAMSAPWYIDFDGKPRVTQEAVEFFREWLSEYEERLKRLPADELAPHVPFVRAARAFWESRTTTSSVSP